MAEPPQDIGVRDETVRIERMAAGGRGVGRFEGKVWFVQGAVVGDSVRARPVRNRDRYVEARAVGLVDSSPHRRVPACPIQPICGGCPWMVLDEGSQRTAKAAIVAETLGRVGRLESVQVEPIRAAGTSFGYRNKTEMILGLGPDGRPRLGYVGIDRHPVDVERCAVQHTEADAVLASAREYLLDPSRARAYFHRRDPFRLVLRRSWSSGEMLVAVRESRRKLPAPRAFAAHLIEAQPKVVGVVRLVGSAGRRGGTHSEVVAGRGWIEERIDDMCFRVPAGSFLQVNPVAHPLLLETVLDEVGPPDGLTVLDLYGGVGVFGFALARRGERVRVCEADPEAIRCGRDAAAGSGLDLQFIHSDVLGFLAATESKPAALGRVVVNPPRTGMGREVVEALAAHAPKRIVIVSCDAATLARDAAGLADRGYRVERAIPIDLFPQTAHVETVLTLSRLDSSG